MKFTTNNNLVILDDNNTEFEFSYPAFGAGKMATSIVLKTTDTNDGSEIQNNFDGASVDFYSKLNVKDEWSKQYFQEEPTVFHAVNGQTDDINQKIDINISQQHLFKCVLTNSTSNTKILLRIIFY